MKILGVLLLSTLFFVKAQDPFVDSLLRITRHVKQDSVAKIYSKLAFYYTGVNADSVRKYAYKAAQLASDTSVAKGDANIQIGNSYHMQNKTDSALIFYNKALAHFRRIGNERGIGKAYQSFALVKKSLGDIQGSLDDSKKAYDIYDKINFMVGKIGALSNISSAYLRLNQLEEAALYARKSFFLSKSLNDNVRYYQCMNDYAGMLKNIKQWDSAVFYFQQAIPFLERHGMHNLLVVSYNNMAQIYYDYYKKNNISLSYLYKATEQAKLCKATDNLRYLYRDLAYFYIKKPNSDSAVMYMDKMTDLIDSLNIQTGLESTKELQTKYETEKKDLQIKQQESDIQFKTSENKRKSVVIWLSLAALAGTGFFAAMAFINFRKTQKANQVIEGQKKNLETKNTEITQQKHLVEEKQKEIIDSITYAKRIQQAVLTGEEVWNKVTKEHFI